MAKVMPVGCGFAIGFIVSSLFWSRNFGASTVTGYLTWATTDL